jgi:hypothetical protein
VLAWYAKAKEIRACGDNDFWEEDGGGRRDYLDTITLLDRALGIPIWSAKYFKEREFASLVRELEATLGEQWCDINVLCGPVAEAAKIPRHLFPSAVEFEAPALRKRYIAGKVTQLAAAALGFDNFGCDVPSSPA